MAIGIALYFARVDCCILAQPFTTMTEPPSVFALIPIGTCVCSRVSVFPYFPPMSSQPADLLEDHVIVTLYICIYPRDQNMYIYSQEVCERHPYNYVDGQGCELLEYTTRIS